MPVSLDMRLKYENECASHTRFQLSQVTCLRDIYLSEQKHLEEHRVNLEFLVYWSSQVFLFQYCLSCPAKAFINNVFIERFNLIEEFIWEVEYASHWRSQP